MAAHTVASSQFRCSTLQILNVSRTATESQHLVACQQLLPVAVASHTKSFAPTALHSLAETQVRDSGYDPTKPGLPLLQCDSGKVPVVQDSVQQEERANVETGCANAHTSSTTPATNTLGDVGIEAAVQTGSAVPDAQGGRPRVETVQSSPIPGQDVRLHSQSQDLREATDELQADCPPLVKSRAPSATSKSSHKPFGIKGQPTKSKQAMQKNTQVQNDTAAIFDLVHRAHVRRAASRGLVDKVGAAVVLPSTSKPGALPKAGKLLKTLVKSTPLKRKRAEDNTDTIYEVPESPSPKKSRRPAKKSVPKASSSNSKGKAPCPLKDTKGSGDERSRGVVSVGSSKRRGSRPAKRRFASDEADPAYELGVGSPRKKRQRPPKKHLVRQVQTKKTKRGDEPVTKIQTAAVTHQSSPSLESTREDGQRVIPQSELAETIEQFEQQVLSIPEDQLSMDGEAATMDSSNIEVKPAMAVELSPKDVLSSEPSPSQQAQLRGTHVGKFGDKYAPRASFRPNHLRRDAERTLAPRLFDEARARKTPMISWTKAGPQNQGVNSRTTDLAMPPIPGSKTGSVSGGVSVPFIPCSPKIATCGFIATSKKVKTTNRAGNSGDCDSAMDILENMLPGGSVSNCRRPREDVGTAADPPEEFAVSMDDYTNTSDYKPLPSKAGQSQWTYAPEVPSMLPAARLECLPAVEPQNIDQFSVHAGVQEEQHLTNGEFLPVTTRTSLTVTYKSLYKPEVITTRSPRFTQTLPAVTQADLAPSRQQISSPVARSRISQRPVSRITSQRSAQVDVNGSPYATAKLGVVPELDTALGTFTRQTQQQPENVQLLSFETHESDTLSKRSAQEALSSNSKPFPGSPGAESKAVTAHAAERIVKQLPIGVQRTDPFQPLSSDAPPQPRKRTRFQELLRTQVALPIGSTQQGHEEIGKQQRNLQRIDNPDQTLVESEEQQGVDISSNSSSLDITPTKGQSLAEEAEWKRSLAPHQADLLDALITISHHLVRHVVDAETVIDDLVQDYHRNGLSIVECMETQHEKECREYLQTQIARKAKLMMEINTGEIKLSALMADSSKISSNKRASEGEKRSMAVANRIQGMLDVFG
ncbi:hypothetical protein LTR66_003622 [Elasticomyces elasticus]|nr:hypothetical protein LTR28_009187 [Elasticomyces elasticus]KAK4996869.1 hypothetical protein LTR66_003622 [Elasticomyces elasticus]